MFNVKSSIIMKFYHFYSGFIKVWLRDFPSYTRKKLYLKEVSRSETKEIFL